MTLTPASCFSHAIRKETASTRRRVSSDYERGDRPAYQRPPRVHAPRSLASLGPLPFPRDASDNTTTNRPGPPPHLVLSPFHNLHHQRSFHSSSRSPPEHIHQISLSFIYSHFTFRDQLSTTFGAGEYHLLSRLATKRVTLAINNGLVLIILWIDR
jgi:hypothetical protein